MFLMFRLGRPDVLPELDLGIQNAIRRAYRLRKQPGPKDVKRIGKSWTPHATVACWYLWRSLEGAPPTPAKKKRPTAKRAKERPAKKRPAAKGSKKRPARRGRRW